MLIFIFSYFTLASYIHTHTKRATISLAYLLATRRGLDPVSLNGNFFSRLVFPCVPHHLVFRFMCNTQRTHTHTHSWLRKCCNFIGRYKSSEMNDRNVAAHPMYIYVYCVICSERRSEHISQQSLCGLFS